MSYILDALKRADTERERGHAPGLHAQPLQALRTVAPRGQRRGVWLLLAGAVALGGIFTTASVWHGPAGDARPAAAQGVLATATVTLAVPPPIAAPAAAPPAPPPVPAPVAAARSPTLPPVVKTSAAPATPAAVPLLSELPEDIRRQIPPLAITGAVYSENPTQRLLLVNGQVIPQGASAAAEVTIEEIKARSSVFSFRGTRFRVAH